MDFVNINGKILHSGEARINYNDRSFRYGDGLFETMKISEGKILLESFHFERLMNGLNLLKFDIGEFFLADKFRSEIIQICEKNNCLSLARVRLTVSRGHGGLYEFQNNFNYVIESRTLNDEEQTNPGLTIGVFPDAKKSCDVYSNLKSSNFLPYVMAAKFASENQLDDCLVLNIHSRICDSTIANIFWIKDENIFTPPLTEGCVGGVMRRWWIENAQGTSFKAQATRHKIQERVCGIADLENADEIFLTNAIRGIWPVKKFRDKSYKTDVTNNLIATFQKLML